MYKDQAIGLDLVAVYISSSTPQPHVNSFVGENSEPGGAWD
jgi:hypothetical protein